METKYVLNAPLIPGKPSHVKSYDDQGRPRGEYKASYRPERGTVVLYPAPGSWIYGRLTKQEISVRLLERNY